MSRICIPIPASTFISSGSVDGAGGSGIGGSVPTVNVLRTEPNVTTLIGGTSNALNGIATNNSDSYPTGVCVFPLLRAYMFPQVVPTTRQGLSVQQRWKCWMRCSPWGAAADGLCGWCSGFCTLQSSWVGWSSCSCCQCGCGAG